MNTPVVDPKLSLVFTRQTTSMPAESKDESAGHAWQREMERAQTELWLSHGAVGYAPRVTTQADSNVGQVAPVAPESGEREPGIATALETRHQREHDPNSQAHRVLIDTESEPGIKPVDDFLSTEWSPSQLSRFWGSHESGDPLPSRITTHEPPIDRLASDLMALPALMAVNGRQHARITELSATKPFTHLQTNAIAGLIERWSGESVLGTSSTIAGSVALRAAENPLIALAPGTSRNPVPSSPAPAARPLPLLPPPLLLSTAAAPGVLHMAAVAFALREVEGSLAHDALRSGSMARNPPGNQAADQPIRLHADWSDDGVRLWLAMRADLLVGIDSLTAQLQRWMAAQGVRVLSISCNGKQLDMEGRIDTGAADREGRAVGVAGRDLPAGIYPGLQPTSSQELQ